MTPELPRYVVMGRDNVVLAQLVGATEEDARQNAMEWDKQFREHAPHHVYMLTRVPKPVPPRPSVTVAGFMVTYEQRSGGFFYCSLVTVAVSAADFIVAMYENGTLTPWPDDDTLRALLALPEATRVWEREHGGGS